MRLIDADKLPKYDGYVLSAGEIAKAVENAPTVEAEPITLEKAIDYLYEIGWMQEHAKILTEPRHGRWIPHTTLFGEIKVFCSICRVHNRAGTTEFCPNCGAKMDEE